MANFADKLNVELIPNKIDGLGIVLAKGEEKEKILLDIQERSKSLLDARCLESSLSNVQFN